MDNFNTLGPVEPIIPQLRKTFDFLLQKGYLASFSYLPYYDVLKEIIFRDLVIKLKSHEKHFIPEKSKSNGEFQQFSYFSMILERNLMWVHTKYQKEPKDFARWEKEAQREWNLNQLV